MTPLTAARQAALALLLALAASAAHAEVYNAYGTVSAVYPAADGKLLFQLKNTSGSSCLLSTSFYFQLSATDGRIVDRWFTVLETSYATGRRVWLQGDGALCLPNQTIPAWYVINIDF